MNTPLSFLLKETTIETCELLAELLPAIGGDAWWDNLVKEKLSYQQQKHVETGHIAKLEDLDLAALMRVFDRNWYEIAGKTAYPDEGRNLVKEVQQVRNRASHENAAEQPLEDRYHDLDTLKRYLAMIGGSEDLQTKIDEQQNLIMEQIAATKNSAETPPGRGPESTTKTPEAPLNQGVNLALFGKGADCDDETRSLLEEKTYIGIDFGTSTTVVSYIRFDQETQALVAEPVPIKQYDELGRCIEDHLVASCVAWTGQQLLVGQGAAELKSSYDYSRNIWFSFKMQLGVQSILYFRSELSQGKGPVVIETPQQAATVFFQYLRRQVEAFVAEKKLPGQVVYSVSVPAAFEANQRKDLCTALAEAGFVLPSYGIIDEPNAAFISYLFETLDTGGGIAQSLAERKRSILVFDFGAGTCDISILEVRAQNGWFASRSLAISQFHALGGDNIDRQIVRENLLCQLANQSDGEEDFTTVELATAIIPKLQPTAEALKVQICKYVASNWDGKDISPFKETGRTVTGNDVAPFTVRSGIKLKIEKPSLSFADFAATMAPFLTTDEREWSVTRRQEDLVSIFEPVLSAMEKAGIAKDDLDMIIFIGGSSLNPFVQSAIQEYFGRFVEAVLLSDLRTPVAKGAAFNSFMVNGLGREIIKPITSETVYVVTLHGGLQTLLPAGTEIPCAELFISNLEVQRDGQAKVELPICVTNEDKLLHVFEVPADPKRPFVKGEKITLSCCVDENKLLRVSAKIGDRDIAVTLLNPLANRELTPEEAQMLEMRQILYASFLKNKGRPSVHAMLQYAYTCEEAGRFIEAAEAFEAVERLDPVRDFSTTICYLYSRGDRSRLSSKWAAIAHERIPCATTAYNLALTKEEEGDMEAYTNLMEEALRDDPEHTTVLLSYGHHLKSMGSPRGLAMIETAFEDYQRQFDRNTLDENDYHRLQRAALTLGRTDILGKLERREKDAQGDEHRYSDKNLAKSTQTRIQLTQGD